MSVTRLSSSLSHRDSGQRPTSSAALTGVSADAEFASFTLGTTAKEINPTTITPRSVTFIKNVSGDPVLVGFKATAFPFEIPAGAAMNLPWNIEYGAQEVTRIGCSSNQSQVLDGKFFDLSSESARYRFWFHMGLSPVRQVFNLFLPLNTAGAPGTETVPSALNGHYLDITDLNGYVTRVGFKRTSGYGYPNNFNQPTPVTFTAPVGGTLVEVALSTISTEEGATRTWVTEMIDALTAVLDDHFVITSEAANETANRALFTLVSKFDGYAPTISKGTVTGANTSFPWVDANPASAINAPYAPSVGSETAAPASGGNTLVKVPLLGATTASAVASALANTIDAQPLLAATSSSNTVTVTAANLAEVAAPSNSIPDFTFTVVTEGASTSLTAYSAWIKSTGSSQVVTAVVEA